ncbi:CbtA family protein [Halobaculum sp. EA56]|uniref:CbtA family protein n=1 Tax=Halobaculum sp. EA56 TaxID=3421648 RepID=UPI003EBA5FFD
MLADYLVRGVKAGLVAGVVFGLFVALVANPLVAFADERAHAGHADGTAHEGEHAVEPAGHADEGALSAAVTDAVSVVSGVLWGVFLGAAGFGVAFYFLEPVVPGSGAARSYVFGAAGFLTVSVAPWLVLPPAVPGVERALDPNAATAVYLAATLAGGVASVLGMYAYARVRPSRGRLVATVAGAAPWTAFVVVTVGVAGVPAVPTPDSLPADLAAGLAGVVVFGQALLWLITAGAHARFRERSGRSGQAAGPDGTGLAEAAPAGSR